MSNLSDFAEEDNQLDELRGANRRLSSQVERYKARHAELVAATIQAAKDAVYSYGPIPPVAKPEKDSRTKNNEAALWHLTDWQGAKRTASYDSEIMVRRVERFWQKAEAITNIQRADHPVKDCMILFGGDMVEGLFNFPTQPYEIDATLFQQFVNVSNLAVRTVRQALSIYDRVTVVAEWGNHGRIGSKRDAVPRSDNVDRMVYEMSRQLLAGEPRLTWEDCPDDIQHVEIGNYRALSIHGDEVGRMGFASRNTFINHVNRWKSGAHKWDFRDVYVGHYHVCAQEPMANGEGSIFWTGSTESDNRYANDMLAASSEPSQRLHFIDLEKGRVSAQYPQIWVAD